MITWLRQRFAPKKINDPVLGELLYLGDYWEGGGEFGPIGQKIEWFVDAGTDGPGPSQRALQQAIERKYHGLLPCVVEAVLPHAVPFANQELDQATLSSLLQLTALDIPAQEGEEMRWSLYYECQIPGSPHFVVQMKGWSPTGDVEVSR